MKIVRQISTGDILYREATDFAAGKGILNTRLLFPEIPENDMEETTLTEAELLADAKIAKITAVKTLMETKFKAGHTYNGNPYQCSRDSQFEIMARFNYAVQSKANAVTFPWSGQPENFDKWRDSNNVTQTFATPDDYIAFAKAINSHCNLLVLKAMALKDAINACTTIAQVDAIDINTGWPE